MGKPLVPGNGEGDGPGRDLGTPGGSGGSSGRRRDPRLAWFANGAQAGHMPPSARLAAAVERLAGADRLFPGATEDEIQGMLDAQRKLKARAGALELALIRALIRRNPGPGPVTNDGLPSAWQADLAHEIAPLLHVSIQAADRQIAFAWELEARLPGVGRLLEDGAIEAAVAQAVVTEFSVLGEDQARAAEALILGKLAGKTPGMARRLAQRAAVTVDPDGARRRREQAEKHDARVAFYADHTGAFKLFAAGLPADEALKADQKVSYRARRYRQAGIYPDATMDKLRAMALLDLVNGITVEKRTAMADAEAAAKARAAADARAERERARCDAGGDFGSYPPMAGPDGDYPPPDDGEMPPPPDDSDPDAALRPLLWPPDPDDESDPGYPRPGYEPPGWDEENDCYFPGDEGSGSRHEGPGDGGSGPDDGPSGGAGGVGTDDDDPGLPANVNLTIVLPTLLGMAERPGEAPGIGTLDPALSRILAAQAAASSRSRFCVTVTSPDGHAIGHGCARPAPADRQNTKKRRKGAAGQGNAPPGSRDGPDQPWSFTPFDDPEPDGGYGTWRLTLPGGRQLTVDLHPMPVTNCDHRYETRAYRPGALLRHLVEIRDGTCTHPSCSHPATQSDFEHAVPFDQGGRTCACNAGARSRRCHRVKQMKGWKVTQPRPGWHRWRTPTGRTYTQGPKEYPN
jgi:hypothetical protein